MATIKVNKAYTMPMDELKQGIEKLGENLKAENGLEYHWETEQKVSLKHKAGKGDLKIEADQVVLQLKLGMLYSAMAPMIKKRIVELADELIY